MGTLRIISRSEEAFRDRIEAGRMLANELSKVFAELLGDGIAGQDEDIAAADRDSARPVVLGIPRGGVIVARELARALKGDLDIVLARKLGAPGNPELAIGAISETGKVFLHDRLIRETDADRGYLDEEQALQRQEIARRAAQYRAVRPKVPLRGRVTIVTDDGVATGATMRAALWSARQEKPLLLVAAIPVAPDDTIQRLAADADDLICLRVPEFFGAVGHFYRDFRQVEDDELIEVLTAEMAQAKGST